MRGKIMIGTVLETGFYNNLKECDEVVNSIEVLDITYNTQKQGWDIKPKWADKQRAAGFLDCVHFDVDTWDELLENGFARRDMGLDIFWRIKND